MDDLGAIPTVILDEKTSPGGYHGPCVDLPPERRPLTPGELLEAWHADAWGGES